MEWSPGPFWLSIKLAFYTTLFLTGIGIPLIYYIHFSKRMKPFYKAVVSLPFVLPPSVIGYYLLVAFSPDGWAGSLFESFFDLRLAFSFQGLVVASVIFSLPFMLNPILSGLENLPDSLEEAAYTLGKNRWQTFIKVLLPNVKSSLLIAMVMTFAHTIGEFGVVLMIGGSIPGETRVASVAIYNQVEALNYQTANVYALIMLVFSFVVLMVVYLVQGYRNPGLL